jgi:peptidoglycan/LPS O-acetylase OafA/YrhL
MILGIFTHGSLAYVTWPVNPWPVIDRSGFAAAQFIFLSLFLFRMPVFFLISGFFSRMLLEKRGMKAFVANRVSRIAIPFVVASIVIGYAIFRIVVMAAAISESTFSMFVRTLRPAHLWFLYYLIGMLAVALLVRRFTAPSKSFLAMFDRILGKVFGSRLSSLVLGMVTALLLVIARRDILVRSYVPNLAILAYFGFFFAIGWWVQRQPRLILTLRRNLAWSSIIAAITLCLFFASIGQAWVADYLRSVASWALLSGFIGLMLAVFDRSSKVIGYLADASYWTYLTHYPVVLGVQLYLTRYAFSGWLKFLIVVAFTSAFCLASFHLLVRDRELGRWLVGRRQRRGIGGFIAPASV